MTKVDMAKDRGTGSQGKKIKGSVKRVKMSSGRKAFVTFLIYLEMHTFNNDYGENISVK